MSVCMFTMQCMKNFRSFQGGSAWRAFDAECHGDAGFDLLGHLRWQGKTKQNFLKTRKGGNSDVLPLKAARRDSISNLTFLGRQI